MIASRLRLARKLNLRNRQRKRSTDFGKSGKGSKSKRSALLPWRRSGWHPLAASDGPFEAGEKVYVFDHYDLSFSRFSVESPTKRRTSWVRVTQKLPASRGSTAGVYHKVAHPSCVFRELPDLPNLQLCSGRGFNRNQVWRQRPPKRRHCDQDPSASPDCELCGKQLRNTHGLQQHMRDKHPRG